MRTAAAESLPFLLECARIRGPGYLTDMWQYMCPELLKAVDSEPELDVKAEHMYAIAQVWTAAVCRCVDYLAVCMHSVLACSLAHLTLSYHTGQACFLPSQC